MTCVMGLSTLTCFLSYGPNCCKRQRQPVHQRAVNRKMQVLDRDRRLLRAEITSRKQDRAAEVQEQTGPTQRQTLHQVSSMRSLVFLPLLLCAAVCVVQVRAEVKAVKLCGREFLRAVVYTCGGSRWRRFLTDTDVDGEQSSLESLSSNNPGSELTKRDINNILTTVCCQVGCRKSDLTFLC
ncbi:insulin-like 5a [Centropristis striata]|uniref:insulin-like 5a n=1 Tax=Centropristis striata TaxID=184440 RepID=UPI0027DF9E5F|nr:insulin-like 5a [Centropristis striata]XP_059196328.1 insulin-like 5a [Centropristis striata]